MRGKTEEHILVHYTLYSDIKICLVGVPSREDRMITEGQAFLRSYVSAPHPPVPTFLSRQQVASLSQSFCVSLVELTDRRWGGGDGCGAQSKELTRGPPELVQHFRL